MQTQNPDEVQEVDVFQPKVLSKLQDIEKAINEQSSATRTLTETLAAHVRQNIDTFQKINEYIGEQMAYRLFRQGIEENSLELELAKKGLELEYAQKKFDALQAEHEEDTEESERLRLDYQKQALELENMKKNLELLQTARTSTKDKIAAVKAGSNINPFNQRIKETVILTALATLTAAAVGGVIAFFVFFVRFYIENLP